MAYIDELTSAIEKAKDILEKDLLQKLRSEYSLQATAVRGMLEMLINKRIIHSDLYSYDDNMSEIKLPETSPFPDSEKSTQIGERLSHYSHALDFITNHYQFNCKYLSLKKIVILKNLADIFVWDNFTVDIESPNTAALSSILQQAEKKVDKITIDILKNTIDQLSESLKIIRPIIENLTIFHRCGYKVFIRKSVLITVPNKELAPGNDIDDMLHAVKKAFSRHFSKKPFFQDLVVEVLKEDYTQEGEKLRQRNLDSLNFSPTAKKKEEQVDKLQFLLSGLKILASAGTQLEVALEKTLFNEDLINKESKTFFSKIIDALRKAFNIKVPEKEITVIVEDPITKSRKKEIINLNAFKVAIENKIKIFNNISNPSMNINLKLRQIPEQVLFNDFSRYIAECNDLLDKLAGLDQYYKTIKPSVREKIKGIKIEITTIKNSIINANQYKAEYASLTEAESQMQKMGLI